MQIFSVVFQDFKLFAFPLDENIAAGEQVDKARLKQVLTKIGLNEFAERLPAEETHTFVSGKWRGCHTIRRRGTESGDRKSAV